MQKQRNGTIELMRFLFATGVVLTHAVGDLFNYIKIIGHIGNVNITFFKNGYIGVEFFFVLSGFFMAKTIFHRISSQETSKSIGEETVSFLWTKIKPILPYYLFACTIMMVVYFYIGDSFLDFLSRLPSLVFLQQTGAFEKSFISISWYLSAMIIAMAIIYPVCKKYYTSFTVLIAPLSGLLIVGAIIYNTGNLGNVTEWALITYKSNFRAIAEVALGTTCFEVSRRISTKEFKNRNRMGLSLIACVCYGFAFLFMNCDVSLKFSAHVLILLCIAITITLSGVGWISQKRFMQNKIFIYLGSISLPLYLFQNVPRYLVPYMFPSTSKWTQCILMYFGTLVLAILSHIIVMKITHKRSKVKT